MGRDPVRLPQEAPCQLPSRGRGLGLRGKGCIPSFQANVRPPSPPPANPAVGSRPPGTRLFWFSGKEPGRAHPESVHGGAPASRVRARVQIPCLCPSHHGAPSEGWSAVGASGTPGWFESPCPGGTGRGGAGGGLCGLSFLSAWQALGPGPGRTPGSWRARGSSRSRGTGAGSFLCIESPLS